MFLKFIFRALQYRKQRLILAFSALAVAATLATVLFGIYGSVEQRIRAEFQGYGANIVAVPANGLTISREIATAARGQGAEAAPFLIGSTTLGGRVVAVNAFDPPATLRLTPYWHMEAGTREITAGECVAGSLLQLEMGAKTGVCTVKGIVSTGGAEDSQLLVRLEESATRVSLVQIRAPGARVEAVRAALAKAFPEASFRTVESVAETESNVVLKVRAALLLVTLVILAITTLCVASNFSEMVMERSREIGILKALGALERSIAALFISESAALALLASVAGYVAGLIAEAAIGREIFGGAFRLEAGWQVPVAVTVVMLTVASVATAIATAQIRGIQPAVILRGE